MHTDLWDFAIKLYALPGVEAACLTLQAEGADVCLLLCGAWLERRRTPLNEKRIEALRQLCVPWQQDVVQPLRSIRQQWRTGAACDDQLAALRERVKALELDAERLQLERLQALCTTWPDHGTASLESWLTALAPTEARHHSALQVLRAAIQRLQDAEVGD